MTAALLWLFPGWASELTRRFRPAASARFEFVEHLFEPLHRHAPTAGVAPGGELACAAGCGAGRRARRRSSARPWRASCAPARCGASAASRARLLVGVFGQRAALRVAEGVGQEHLRVAVVGLEQHDVGVRVAALVALHAELQPRMDQRAEGLASAPPAGRRRPAAGCAPRRCASTRWRGACAGVERHQRVQAQQQVQRPRRAAPRRAASSSARRRRSSWPSISTGGNSPGSAALACTACEIGTWSQPGWPKGAASPLSRSVATSTSLRRSSRKSLLRPGARTGARSLRFQLPRCENSPVGSARPRRSSADSSERALATRSAPQRLRGQAAAAWPARRANSPQAGRMQPAPDRRCRRAAPSFSMKARAQLARRHAVGQRRRR